MMARMMWTEELSARIAELWKTKSSAEIVADLQGDGLSVSRNAVIGRLHRMGMRVESKDKIIERTPRKYAPQQPRIPNKTRRAAVNHGAVVQKINRRQPETPKLKVDRFIPRAADIVSLRKPLLDLRAMECRWPDEHRNAERIWTFCGHPTCDGSSYCPSHKELARGEGTPSERNAVKIRRAA